MAFRAKGWYNRRPTAESASRACKAVIDFSRICVVVVPACRTWHWNRSVRWAIVAFWAYRLGGHNELFERIERYVLWQGCLELGLGQGWVHFVD